MKTIEITRLKFEVRKLSIQKLTIICIVTEIRDRIKHSIQPFLLQTMLWIGRFSCRRLFRQRTIYTWERGFSQTDRALEFACPNTGGSAPNRTYNNDPETKQTLLFLFASNLAPAARRPAKLVLSD